MDKRKDRKKNEYLIPPVRMWDGVEKFMVILGAIVAILVLVLFCSIEDGVWYGIGISLLIFLLWFFVIFNTGESGSGTGCSGQDTSDACDAGGSGDGISSGYDMTEGYYGKHGEFDLNDESRRVSEDMQQFHSSHPDADLTDHYYWDDVLDAETDEYLR